MKTLSFIIPVYNKQDKLEKIFKALEHVKLPRALKLSKVIFVDDGSTDDTFENLMRLARNFPGKFNMEIISYKKHQGMNHATREGIKNSSSVYTLIVDTNTSKFTLEGALRV